MTKKEFVKMLADKLNISQKDANHYSDSFLSCVETALTTGDKELSFVGWGKFKVVKREEKNGRNPKTKQPLIIPAKNVVRFKAGSVLADSVN